PGQLCGLARPVVRVAQRERLLTSGVPVEHEHRAGHQHGEDAPQDLLTESERASPAATQPDEWLEQAHAYLASHGDGSRRERSLARSNTSPLGAAGDVRVCEESPRMSQGTRAWRNGR